MTIRNEAFIAIEQSLTARLSRSWAKLALATQEKVSVAIQKKDWPAATKLAVELDTRPVFEENREYVKYTVYAALFFGATRLTEDAKATVIATGVYEPTVERMVKLIEKMVEVNFAKAVRDELLTLIHEAEDADKQETLDSVQKAERIAQPFVSFQKSGDSMLQLISNLNTSRVSAFGFTAEAEVLKVDEYAINEQLDVRICPVCIEMHGRRFRVADARSSLETILSTSNPDDLRTLQPWPKQDQASVAALKQMSSKDIVAKNWHMPPYHPGCRGLLVHVGKVPALTDTGKLVEQAGVQEQHVADFKASIENFREYGIAVTEEQVDYWNKLVGVDPGLLLGALLGKQPKAILDQVLDAATGLKDSSKAGISSFSISPAKKLVDIKLDGAAFDSEISAWMKYAPEEDVMELISLAVKDQASGVGKKILRSWSKAWDTLEVSSVELAAEGEVGPYAWAKYGWVPSEDSWNTLRAKLQTKADGLKMSMAARQVVDAALASTNPKALWALVDMTEVVNGRSIGFTLLADESWVGALSLADDEAILRFRHYVGE